MSERPSQFFHLLIRTLGMLAMYIHTVLSLTHPHASLSNTMLPNLLVLYGLGPT